MTKYYVVTYGKDGYPTKRESISAKDTNELRKKLITRKAKDMQIYTDSLNRIDTFLGRIINNVNGHWLYMSSKGIVYQILSSGKLKPTGQRFDGMDYFEHIHDWD